ncbi:hypothetical protein ILYODFUR_006450 [Ilyodon furcidens]|uniref:Uncharacterized protein n=1 Tax=Ilyodon furcidens TaxID=33524 RepID=A0ABV0SIY8_9TELE
MMIYPFDMMGTIKTKNRKDHKKKLIQHMKGKCKAKACGHVQTTSSLTFSITLQSLLQQSLKTCPDITVEGMVGMRGIRGHSHLGTVSSERKRHSLILTARAEATKQLSIKISHNGFL